MLWIYFLQKLVKSFAIGILHINEFIFVFIFISCLYIPWNAFADETTSCAITNYVNIKTVT